MANDTPISIIGNRRCTAQNPDPLYADAVSVSRFWRLVDVRTGTECWPWTGDTDKNGYGVFFYKGRKAGAHEFALSFTTGERRLPGLDTCHWCDNPPCCNPLHLRFDTRVSNVHDMRDRGRAAKPNARLAPADVVLMRERRQAGAPQKLLAEQFGVSEAYVSTIVRGLTWADAGGPIQSKNNQYRRNA